MKNLLTDKTVSLSELKDPEKMIKKAGDKPVAILSGNKLEGYFVPAFAVHRTNFKPAEPDEVEAAIAEVITRNKAILDYLKDK